MFKNLFKPKPADIVSPMCGTIIPLEKVNDPVFSEKSMGDGFAVKFSEGNVYSPVDGEIILTFPTKHAIGIKSDDRNEILVHIGLDTVTLNGEGFDLKVEVGQRVQKGDLLVEVKHEFFKDKGIDMTSPIIITNLKGRRVVMLKKDELVKEGDYGLIAIKV